MEISKSDWKLFRERIAIWQERYMEKLANEYVELLTSEKSASDRFWELEKRIYKDKKHPGVIIELRKSHVMWDIIDLIKDEVITVSDLEGFSDELIDEIKTILHI